MTGLTRARDTLLAEQRELHQQRARGKSDENLISEISRLDSLMIVAKDDLVCVSFILTSTTKNCVCVFHDRGLANSVLRALRMN